MTTPVSARIVEYLKMPRVPSAIAELDGLRGLAIVLVLARHAVRPFSYEDQLQPLFPVSALGNWDAVTPLLNGWCGVDLFFVLSGFLITYHLMKRWANNDETGAGFRLRWVPVKTYLLKRFLRIAPAYYAVLFLVVLGAFPFYDFSTHDLIGRTVYHVLFLQDYLNADIVVAFWSLGVEEKFYLLIPLFLAGIFLLKSLRGQLAMLTGVYLIPLMLRWWMFETDGGVASDSYIQYFYAFRSPFHLSVDSLLVGSAVALLFHHRGSLTWFETRSVRRGLLLGSVLVLAGLLVPQVLLAERTWFSVVLLPNCLAIGFGTLMLALLMGARADAGLFARFFRSRVMFFLGKISYSLYLVHMIFMMALKDGLETVLGQVGVVSVFIAFVPVFIGVSLGAALILHYGVEKPFLLIKDRL